MSMFGIKLLGACCHTGENGPACHPGRLWSLWDIMQQFRAHELGLVLVSIKQLECECVHIRLRNGGGTPVPAEMREVWLGVLKGAELLARDSGFSDTQTKANKTRWHHEHNPGTDISATEADLRNLQDVLLKDLHERKFCGVEPSANKCVDNPFLFGGEVLHVFGVARQDIIDAGNCIAAECGTAAVFHLMRIAEHGLRVVAKRLKAQLTHKGKRHPIEYADWDAVITEVKNRVKTRRQVLNSGPAREKTLQFYADVADQCEYMKELWRNPVSHTRRHYSVTEATGIMERVKQFMQRLARELRTAR